MGVPLTVVALWIIRTPREDWSRLAQEVARQERLKEDRPRTGVFWRAFHRFGDLVGIIALVFFIVVVVYNRFMINERPVLAENGRRFLDYDPVRSFRSA